MKRSFILLLVLCLCGCTTIREARSIQHNNGSPSRERTPTAAELGLGDGHTLRLVELESLALDHHPSVRQATSSLASAYLTVKTLKADFLPTVSGNVSYQRATRNQDRHQQDAGTDGSWNTSLSLELMLYDFGKTDQRCKQAVEQYNAARYDVVAAQNSVIYGVRTAYFSLLRTMALAKTTLETADQYKDHLEHIQFKHDIGASTPYELTKAQVDYSNALLAVNSSANSVQTSWAALAEALGLAEIISFPIAADVLPEYDLDPAAEMALARQREPGLAALTAKATAASIYIDQMIAELYPTVSLNFASTLGGQSTALPWLWNFSGASSVAQTLFQGGQKLNAIKDATHQLQAARAAVALYEQNLYKQIRQTTLNAGLARQQMQVSDELARQAKDYLDIVNEEFTVGKATVLERTDAQVAYSDAQTQAISATYDFQDAMAVLAKLTGNTPEPTSNQP